VGHHSEVWRSPEPTHRIYVALGVRLGCTVWFQSNRPDAAKEAFRRKVQSEIKKASPSIASVTVFRDGEVSPGLSMLAYVVRFPGERVGLMWSVYMSTTLNPATVWYEAARVRQ